MGWGLDQDEHPMSNGDSDEGYSGSESEAGNKQNLVGFGYDRMEKGESRKCCIGPKGQTVENKGLRG